MKFREANLQDSDTVVELVIAMLHEMAAHGGRAPNDEECVRSRLRERLLDVLETADHVCLLALAQGREEPMGIVEASVVSTSEIFRPTSKVHVHTLYVVPCHRGEGIGRQLLAEALMWGKRRGCTEAGLSVLVGNPARKLYERLGFEVFELEMRLEW